MSGGAKIIVAGVAGLAVVVCAGWYVWNRTGPEGTAAPKGTAVTVLCAKCGHHAEQELSSLQNISGGPVSRNPGMGPGYRCDKCGQSTLYMNPKTCPDCKIPFLPTPDDFAARKATCPKCGKAV